MHSAARSVPGYASAMRRLCTLAVLLALAGLGPAASGPAAAQTQINRCIGPDGSAIYTDRRCGDIGALARPVPGESAGAQRRIALGCARTLRDLVHEISAAVDNRDVNRLAGVYHFAGMSHRGGYGVMDRLDAIVQRPLVDIAAVRPEAAAVAATARGNSFAASTFPQPPAAAAPAPRRSAPTALRLEQTVGDRITPRSTVLNLRRHMGCWWVSL